MDRRIRNIIIILSGLFLLISIGYSYDGRASVTIVENIVSNVIIPTQKTMMKAGNSIDNKVDSIFKIWSYKEENKNLRAEVKSLQKEVLNLKITKEQMADFEKLKSNLHYINRKGFDQYITADVVSKNMGNWFKSFDINVGKKDGVSKYSVVIVENALIGKVYEVGDHYSKVVTIIDTKSNISFKLLNESGEQGFIYSAEGGKLKGQMFNPNISLKKGEKVVTSGLGIYPDGLVIGEITEIHVDNNKLLKEVTIEPKNDFRDLEIVTVINFKSKDEEWFRED